MLNKKFVETDTEITYYIHDTNNIVTASGEVMTGQNKEQIKEELRQMVETEWSSTQTS